MIGTIAGPDILAQFFTLLDGLTYPANPGWNNFTPKVFWVGLATEKDKERIELVGEISEADVEWVRTSAQLVEVVQVRVRIVSYTPGTSGPDALVRWKALADVVDTGLRDQTTGQPQGLTDGTNWRLIPNYRIAEYVFELEPADQGYRVDGELRYRVETYR